MRRSAFRKFSHVCVSVALALPMVALPGLDGLRAARAQGADAPLQGGGDPPGRVGRVARLSGTVSFHAADADHWEPATLNYPVTSGNAFWTQPGAAADIDLGGARVRLDQGTAFTVDTLGDQVVATTVGQGHLAIDLQELPQGETATLRTPRGVVTFRQAGRYGVLVGDTNRPTIVTVNEGAAEVEAPGVALSVGAHQAAEITGVENFSGIVVAEAPDALISALVPVERAPLSPTSLGPPPEVLEMTGYEAIADTGAWEQAPDYGPVWYPPVARDWVPYRQGRWSWVAPWGWTWVDDAPWGFAPSHYGRWVEINDRWAWTPQDRGASYHGRPVYAPALVTFVGVAAGVALGVGLAHSVGWIPLGPREAYRPPYRASEGYGRRVNGGGNTTINTTTITNTTINNTRFVNSRATTVVPAVAMQQSLPVANRVLPSAQVQQTGLQPVLRPAVQPNLSTRGMTPAAAQTMNLPAATAGTPTPASPGPAFRRDPAGQPGRGTQPGRPVSTSPASVPAMPGIAAGPAARPGSAFSPGPGGAGFVAPGPPIGPRALGGGGGNGAASPGGLASPRPNVAPGAGPPNAGSAPAFRPQPQAGGGFSGPGAVGRPNPVEPGFSAPQRPVTAARPAPAIQAAPQAVAPGAVLQAPRPTPPQISQPPAPRPAPPPRSESRPQPQFQPRPEPRPEPRQSAPPRAQPAPQAAPPQARPQPQAAPAPQARPAPAARAAPQKSCPPGRLNC